MANFAVEANLMNFNLGVAVGTKIHFPQSVVVNRRIIFFIPIVSPVPQKFLLVEAG